MFTIGGRMVGCFDPRGPTGTGVPEAYVAETLVGT